MTPAPASAMLVALALALAATAAVSAPPPGAPPGTPPDATGLCGDGGHTVRPERKGACKGREGVREWWGPGAPASRPAHAGSAASAPAPAPKKTP